MGIIKATVIVAFIFVVYIFYIGRTGGRAGGGALSAFDILLYENWSCVAGEFLYSARDILQMEITWSYSVLNSNRVVSVSIFLVPLYVSWVMFAFLSVSAWATMFVSKLWGVPAVVISVMSAGVRLALNWNSRFMSASWSLFCASLWYVLNPSWFRISSCRILFVLKSSMIWILASYSWLMAFAWICLMAMVARRRSFALSMPRCVWMARSIRFLILLRNGSAHVILLLIR